MIPQWINVEYKPYAEQDTPNISRTVLLCAVDADNVAQYAIAWYQYSSRLWHIVGAAAYTRYGIYTTEDPKPYTHWCELPDPPVECAKRST